MTVITSPGNCIALFGIFPHSETNLTHILRIVYIDFLTNKYPMASVYSYNNLVTIVTSKNLIKNSKVDLGWDT